LPVGDENGGPVYADFVTDALAHLKSDDLSTLARAARSMLELSSAGLWLASALRWLLLIIAHEPNNHQALQAVIESLRTFDAPVLKPSALQIPAVAVSIVAAPVDLATALADSVIAAQLQVLSQSDKLPWLAGRVKSVVSTLSACYRSSGRSEMVVGLDAAMAQALAAAHAAPLVAWVERIQSGVTNAVPETAAPAAAPVAAVAVAVAVAAPVASVEGEGRLTRRSEETAGAPKTLKVDQEKIDRLMNLIGEMVVAKTACPTSPAELKAFSVCVSCRVR
jgi:two-component system chemotaxis sensor kinase CheA